MSEPLSCRAFLKSSAAGTAGTAMGPATAADAGLPAGAADLQSAARGHAPVPVYLIVNRVRCTLSPEPRTTLVDALRGMLALTGTKLACMTLAIEVAGRSVTTIEGLARGGALLPVQQAARWPALFRGTFRRGLMFSCSK